MSKKSASPKKGEKEKDKAPPRPTRCPPGFKWKPQPKLVEVCCCVRLMCEKEDEERKERERERERMRQRDNDRETDRDTDTLGVCSISESTKNRLQEKQPNNHPIRFFSRSDKPQSICREEVDAGRMKMWEQRR